jgi:hypothetical protein
MSGGETKHLTPYVMKSETRRITAAGLDEMVGL